MTKELIDFLYNNREMELYNINGTYIGYICGYVTNLDYAVLVCKNTWHYWSNSFLGPNDFIFKELDESKIERLLYFDVRNVYINPQKTITLYNLYQEHETLKN